MTLEGGLGLPREDCKRLLPELHARGVMVNTVGTTWKMRGEEEEFEEDLVPAPKPQVEVPKPVKERKVGPKGRLLVLADKMSGLPEGPYDSKAAIHKEMMKYSDFLSVKGTEPSDAYVYLIWDRAVEYGLGEEKDEQLWIKHNDKVQLTPRPGYKPPSGKQRKSPKRKAAKVEVRVQAPPKPELHNVQPGTYINLTEMQKSVPPTKAPSVGAGGSEQLPARIVSLVRTAYGGEVPWLGDHTSSTRKLRKVIPIEHWNEAAARTIARKLKEGDSWRPYLSTREAFQSVEWDFLAWETIKNLPMHVLAPWFRDELKDMDLTCEACMARFVFLASEQDFLERKFGSVIPPRTCKMCRAKRKEMARG